VITPVSDLYDRDFLAWANEQAALLRAGDFSAADIANIAEEIDSMGRSEKRELERRLTNLPLHLLKWEVQTAPSLVAAVGPDRQGRDHAASSR
jgi:hypothetical protein